MHPFPMVSQAILINKFGQTRTGGITPSERLPQIARAFGLSGGIARYPMFFSMAMMEQLPNSMLFCGYTVRWRSTMTSTPPWSGANLGW